MFELNFDLPKGVAVLAGPVDDYPLLPEEAACIEVASESRRRQFASGRHFARAALGCLNGPCEAIPRTGRLPCWPTGYIGSISHTDTLAVAAAAPAGVRRAVGIDIEHCHRLKGPLVRRVLTANERQRRWPDEREGAVVFSAKEACYKAINPTTGDAIGFQEVEVAVEWTSSTFSTRYLGQRERNRRLECGAGQFAFLGGQVVTIFLL